MARIYYPSSKESAVRQGEILTGIVEFIPNEIPSPELLYGEGEVALSFRSRVHPFAIVVTQDCDLDWDYAARTEEANLADPNSEQKYRYKKLHSVILCEVDTARNIRNISDKGLMNRAAWDLVKSNRHERFHFLEGVSSEFDLQQEGMDELTVDFKRLFGIDAEKLYDQIRTGLCRRRSFLIAPYLQHFSSRFSTFHSRVALPEPHRSI